MKQVLQELLTTRHYQLLSNTKSHNHFENFKSALKDLISTNLDCLLKPEIIYFQRSLKLKHRLPIFYGLLKVHKSPISLRPVVSSVNSLNSIFSNWLDFKMKKLLPLVKFYTKNSFDVLEDLKILNISSNALLIWQTPNLCTLTKILRLASNHFMTFLHPTKNIYQKVSQSTFSLEYLNW